MKIFYLGMLAVLWLTGCTSPAHPLVKEGSAPFVGGELGMMGERVIASC